MNTQRLLGNDWSSCAGTVPARADMQDIQRIIDKLLGNYAPVKVANTIVDGENKPASIRPEPIERRPK